MSNPLDPMDCSLPGSSVHGDFPSKNTGVGCHLLLQGIFLTQGLNQGPLHYRWILCHWATGFSIFQVKLHPLYTNGDQGKKGNDILWTVTWEKILRCIYSHTKKDVFIHNTRHPSEPTEPFFNNFFNNILTETQFVIYPCPVFYCWLLVLPA